MALLEVQDIDVYYGSVQALRGVSLEIEAGERVALLGANGAGKTTTLRTISGLMSPRRGTIVFDGEDIAGRPAYSVVGRGVAHGPEGRALFPGLSVEENLRFGYLPRRKDKAGYEPALARTFDYFPRLKERRKQAAGTMSGGEQQMLVVARALMSSPRLLIVDELSLGLAPKIVSLLFEIIRDVNRAGTAVLIVEQFVHMALENTDRAYVLTKGAVVLEGRSADLLGSDELLASYLGGEAVGIEQASASPRRGGAVAGDGAPVRTPCLRERTRPRSKPSAGRSSPQQRSDDSAGRSGGHGNIRTGHDDGLPNEDGIGCRGDRLRYRRRIHTRTPFARLPFLEVGKCGAQRGRGHHRTPARQHPSHPIDNLDHTSARIHTESAGERNHDDYESCP